MNRTPSCKANDRLLWWGWQGVMDSIRPFGGGAKLRAKLISNRQFGKAWGLSLSVKCHKLSDTADWHPQGSLYHCCGITLGCGC